MPILFTCPHCGLQTNIGDEHAGQSGPCAVRQDGDVRRPIRHGWTRAAIILEESRLAGEHIDRARCIRADGDAVVTNGPERPIPRGERSARITYTRLVWPWPNTKTGTVVFRLRF